MNQKKKKKKEEAKGHIAYFGPSSKDSSKILGVVISYFRPRSKDHYYLDSLKIYVFVWNIALGLRTILILFY
jgi:hypothetical protein